MTAQNRTPIEIRSDLCNETLVWLFFLGIPGFVLSLLRMVEVGWKPIMTVDVALFLSMATLTVFRSRFPYVLRAGGLIVITFGIAVSSQIAYGAPNGLVFFVSACIMAAVLFDDTAGIAATVAAVGLLVLHYVALDHGLLPAPDVLAMSKIAWAMSAYSVVMASIGPLIATNRARKHLNIARKRAEEATKAKARFLATMSHEVRTPMNGVVGMVDLMMSTKLDGDQRAMLQTVREAGHALLTVINDILDFSKIEAERLELEAVAVPLAALVEDVATSLSPMALAKRLRLVTFVDPRLPETVIGDPTRQRQILTNLGSNAVKFAQGEVRIAAELLSEDNDRARVQLIVTDDGPGIDQATLARLFEEFSQADSSTARRFGGTGLGLAICKRLARLMDGHIEVSSVLGQGSTFTCMIPLARGDTPPRSAGDFTGLTVLFASESPALSAAACRYLEHWNATVLQPEAPSPSAILRMLNEAGRRIDVAVLPDLPFDEAVATAANAGKARLVIGRSPGQKLPEALKDVTVVEVNPMRRAALATAVAAAAGRKSPEELPTVATQDVEVFAPVSRDQALARGQLILVAEDYGPNQEVLRRQLARLGFACDLADTGDRALALWRANSYAVVLTDCHMPGLDGFGLTAAIRAEESARGTHQPIVAVTASALPSETEECRAAGMDDIVTKPIAVKALQAVLGKWCTQARTASAESLPAASTGEPVASDILDLNPMIDAFGQIDEAARDMLRRFVRSIERLITELHQQIAAHDCPGGREIAHKARGAAANAGAREMAALMEEIEMALMENRLVAARKNAERIAPAWQRLTAAILAL